MKNKFLFYILILLSFSCSKSEKKEVKYYDSESNRTTDEETNWIKSYKNEIFLKKSEERISVYDNTEGWVSHGLTVNYFTPDDLYQNDKEENIKYCSAPNHLKDCTMYELDYKVFSYEWRKNGQIKKIVNFKVIYGTDARTNVKWNKSLVTSRKTYYENGLLESKDSNLITYYDSTIYGGVTAELISMESWYENGNKRSETIQNPNAKEDEITKEQNSWKENGKWSHGLYWRKNGENFVNKKSYDEIHVNSYEKIITN